MRRCFCFFASVGNIPFLLAKRGCEDREEYFRAAQIDLQFIEKLYAPMLLLFATMGNIPFLLAKRGC
jgi:hypothetical protein